MPCTVHAELCSIQMPAILLGRCAAQAAAAAWRISRQTGRMACLACREEQIRAAAGAGRDAVGGHAGVAAALRARRADAHPQPDERGRHCVHPGCAGFSFRILDFLPIPLRKQPSGLKSGDMLGHAPPLKEQAAIGNGM